MPLSRNRKLTKNELKRRKPIRFYRQSLHRAYVAYLRGDVTWEQYQAFRFLSLRKLGLGKAA